MASCNAGHGCSITCHNGCLAIYYLPNGPCKTACSNSLDEVEIAEGVSFSISVNDLPPHDAARIFRKVLGEKRSHSLATLTAPLSIQLADAKLADVREAIEKHMQLGK